MLAKSALLLGLLSLVAHSPAQQSPTPPMGWNSYDCFGYAVTEDQVMANANFIQAHLRDLGWKYVVVDYVWAMPKLGMETPLQNAQFEPRMSMDKFGRLLPDPVRFPSSTKSEQPGFRKLADSIHRMGLKFGIHLMRGIPRQAVGAKTPIEPDPKDRDAAQWTAEDAADKSSICPWLNHMYGLNMKTGAGQAYLNSLFRQYAAWGVDFVKVDDMTQPYHAAEIEGYRKAITACGRPMVLSLSPGETPITQAEHVAGQANMWRLLGDFWDNWPELDHAFSVAAAWNPTRNASQTEANVQKFGVWPDLDMLPFGHLREYGPYTGPLNIQSRFTPAEVRTVMSLWAICQSPLMFGGNLPEIDADTLAVITNKAVLEVDQRGSHPVVLQEGPITIWSANTKPKDAERGYKYLAVFNRTSAAMDWSWPVERLGMKAAERTDLWTGSILPAASLLTGNIPSHGCALYILRPKSNPAR